MPNEFNLPMTELKCQKCNGWTKRKVTNSRLAKENKERYCPRCDKTLEVHPLANARLTKI